MSGSTMKGCADKSILGLALAAQYLSQGTDHTTCWEKKGLGDLDTVCAWPLSAVIIIIS